MATTRPAGCNSTLLQGGRVGAWARVDMLHRVRSTQMMNNEGLVWSCPPSAVLQLHVRASECRSSTDIPDRGSVLFCSVLFCPVLSFKRRKCPGTHRVVGCSSS